MTPRTARRTWRGTLVELWEALNREAETGRERWIAYSLSAGARVALRRDADGRRRLAISRSAKNPSRDAWRSELAVFRKHFEIEHWTLHSERFDPFVQGAIYQEPPAAAPP